MRLPFQDNIILTRSLDISLTCLYFCVALDRKYHGDHDQEIVDMLRGLKLDDPNPDLQSDSQAVLRGRIDEMNTVLGKSTLARALRRMGEVSQAERM